MSKKFKMVQTCVCSKTGLPCIQLHNKGMPAIKSPMNKATKPLCDSCEITKLHLAAEMWVAKRDAEGDSIDYSRVAQHNPNNMPVSEFPECCPICGEVEIKIRPMVVMDVDEEADSYGEYYSGEIACQCWRCQHTWEMRVDPSEVSLEHHDDSGEISAVAPIFDEDFLDRVVYSCRNQYEKGLIKAFYLSGQPIKEILSSLQTMDDLQTKWLCWTTRKNVSVKMRISTIDYDDIALFLDKSKGKKPAVITATLKVMGRRSGYQELWPTLVRNTRCYRLHLAGLNPVEIALILQCSYDLITNMWRYTPKDMMDKYHPCGNAKPSDLGMVVDYGLRTAFVMERIERSAAYWTVDEERWNANRELAFERDQGTCRHCGKPGREVHHIAPFEISLDHSLDNLVTLCGRCHRIAERECRRG